MTQTQQVVEQIDPKTLKPHPDNPRIEIDETSEEFLAFVENIRSNNIIQPIIATKIEPDQFILAGHRRTRAAIAAKFPTVPVIFTTISPGKYAEDWFLSENGQRNDLSPLENARAVLKLQERIHAATGTKPAKGDLSRRLNMPLAQINQSLAILEFPQRIQMLFHRLELAQSSSVHLIKLIDYPDELEAMANRLLSRQVTGSSLATVIRRRLDDLEAEQEAGTFKNSGRKSHFETGHNYVLGASQVPQITRAVAVENLRSNARNKISLFDVNVILENICCQCGMMANESICGTCPLPQMINAMVGRSNPN